MIRFRLFSFLLILLLLGLAGCERADNYLDPSGPLFTGGEAGERVAFAGVLKVVTWNIRYGQEVAEAAVLLRELPELRNADILLLQEMDEEGVAALALALGANYVYIPAMVHPTTDRNFGNAILSPWPITAPHKLLLPHAGGRHGGRRIAARAVVHVGELAILTYSVHTETFWLGPDGRLDQIERLLDDADTSPYLVIGGDFNTLTPMSQASLGAETDERCLQVVTKAAGPTLTFGGLSFTTDAILARGLTPLEAGALAETTASDHSPLWVLLEPQPSAEKGCKSAGLRKS